MSFPLESLSLKFMKLFGEACSSSFCLQGTMLNLRLSSARVGVVEDAKYPDTRVTCEDVSSSQELRLTLTRSPSDFIMLQPCVKSHLLQQKLTIKTKFQFTCYSWDIIGKSIRRSAILYFGLIDQVKTFTNFYPKWQFLLSRLQLSLRVILMLTYKN